MSRELRAFPRFPGTVTQVESEDRTASGMRPAVRRKAEQLGEPTSTGLSTAPGRILVVDDHPQIRRVLRTALVAKGYEVDDADGGEEAIKKVYEQGYDVILLDMNMPDLQGIAVCRTIREACDAGIIMLTVRNSEMDKVRALDAGANDYVTKPFSTPELFARIRAVLRKNNADKGLARLSLTDLDVDFQNRQVLVRGQKVHLTPKEFKFLQHLANRPNKIVPHRELLRAIWGPDYDQQLDYLRTLVKQLRKKIEPQPGKPQYVVTHAWVGYELRVPK